MFLSIGMLKQKYFLADIFILSAEKQPIKLSWRKIECLLIETIYDNLYSIIDAFVLSVFLGAIFTQSRNIVYVILIHSLINLLV